ncbi:hypothetical protein LV157_003795 [Aspergillus fumigatus]|nr:hypothetical protein LV157_003795 [Aspergillus fumigatus]
MEHTWDEMRTSACKSLSVTPPLHQHEGYTAILGSLLSILSRLQNDEQHTLHLQSPEDHLSSDKTLVSTVHVMNNITDEPGWEKRIFDEDCARKWRQKSLDVFNSFSLEMMDWVIEELALQADVEPLENIAEHDKDYEPGPGEQIVNLVDPSLFALAYSHSQVIPDIVIGLDDCLSHSGGAKALGVKWEEHDPFSVINNGRAGTKDHLCPLYDALEQIITGVIPLWNMTLKPLRAERLHRRNRIKSSELNTCRVPTSNSLREILELGSLSDVEDIYDCLWEREKHRPVKSPETRPISLWLDRLRSEKPIDLQTTVRARGLQVIVKLADIKLTPETPRYIGTPWHFQ